MTVGAKYLVYQPKYTDKTKEIRSWRKRGAFDKKRLLPSVGVSLGMNADFSNKISGATSITPKVGILLQHNLTQNFNIVNNFYYNNIGSDFSEFSHIVTATQSLYNRYSIFFENKTVFEKNQNNINLGLGLAYLYPKISKLILPEDFFFEGKAQGFYASFGFSYRIDRHQDTYKDLDINGVKPKNKLGFSKRFLRIFKNKNKDLKTKENKKNNFLGIFGKKKKETEVEKLEREIKGVGERNEKRGKEKRKTKE